MNYISFVRLLCLCVFLNSIISCRSEYVWKDNIVDDIKEDTMEFDIWKRYVFRPELSNGLTGNENITILHPGNRYS